MKKKRVPAVVKHLRRPVAVSIAASRKGWRTRRLMQAARRATLVGVESLSESDPTGRSTTAIERQQTRLREGVEGDRL